MVQMESLLNSDSFKRLATSLKEEILKASSKLNTVKPSPAPDSESQTQFLAGLKNFGAQRGRDLFYPYLSSGIGNGPFVELADGSCKYDMISAIGVGFFGHTHPAFIEEMLRAAPSDIMQGNLQPGVEVKALTEDLLEYVKPRSRLAHVWPTTCGTMANEIALKLVRQKKSPASKIIAFKDCFAGRSTAMQEITDNESYRQGQPTYGEVLYLPFEAPIEVVLEKFHEIMKEHGPSIAALMIEIVQGEGGFRFHDPSWYRKLFTAAKDAGIYVWADEIQTFGRTGELFAFETFKVADLVDIVTVAKALQASVVLFTQELNPKPGLVAGTFSGSNAQLRTARRVLSMLTRDGYLGPEGKISKLSARFVTNLEQIKKRTGVVGQIRSVGGMIGFAVGDATLETTKKYLMRLFKDGVIAFYCGHGPILVRLLPPLGCMTEAQVDDVCSIIESGLERGLEELK